MNKREERIYEVLLFLLSPRKNRIKPWSVGQKNGYDAFFIISRSWKKSWASETPAEHENKRRIFINNYKRGKAGSFVSVWRVWKVSLMGLNKWRNTVCHFGWFIFKFKQENAKRKYKSLGRIKFLFNKLFTAQ